MPNKSARKNKASADKTETLDEHFERIEVLLAGIALGRQTTLQKVSKLIGVRKDKISQVFSPRKEGQEE